MGAAAVLRAEKLVHLSQGAFQQPAQHVGNTAGNRDKRRCDQRFKTILRGFALAQAAAHQAEPGCYQQVGVVTAGILGRTYQRHGLAYGGVQVPRTAAQFGGNLLAGAVLDQTAGQFSLHSLGFGTAGQQQGTFHLHEVRGHVDKLAGNFHAVVLQVADGGRVLVDEFHNVDIIEVHLIFAHEVQQQIKRAFKIFYFKSKNFRQKNQYPHNNSTKPVPLIRKDQRRFTMANSGLSSKPRKVSASTASMI